MTGFPLHRVLRCYPGQWQVHVVEKQAVGGNLCLAKLPEMPSYSVLEVLLSAREGSPAAMGWLDRLKSEAKFNSDSLQNPPKL